MPRRPSYPAPSPAAATDLSLQEQVFRQLRDAIAAGQLKPGARLPASRAYAAEQGLARQTVTIAYERLAAEGFVTTRRGAGTFVSGELPARPTPPGKAVAVPRSRRLQALLASPPRRTEGLPLPLKPGVPALDHFPFALWNRLLQRAGRHGGARLLEYGDPAGLPALRQAIADYVGAVRGVAARPEQIIVTAGAQGAALAAALAVSDPGDTALVETPGYTSLQGALRLVGLELQPLPVDSEGADIARAPAAAVARLALVSPSHHYPLGMTLTLERRLALLAWARRKNAMILEDDYDGEYRFDQPQVTALHSLEPQSQRVLYIGTLSKLLAPGLRLGFLVVPDALVEGVTAIRALQDRHVAQPIQAALADFIGNGHLAAHIRKIRPLYAERRAALLTALRDEAADVIDPSGAAAGLHVLGRLPAGCDDRAIALAAQGAGLGVGALSGFFLAGRPRAADRGLVLGFATAEARTLRGHVARLARVVRAGLAR